MTRANMITADMIPSHLNTHPVKAFAISADRSRALVLVNRPDAFMPWVAATWSPALGDTWIWGNYYRSFEQADAFRAQWIATAHGEAV